MTKKILILPWIMLPLFVLLYFFVIKKRDIPLNDNEQAAYVIGYMVRSVNLNKSAFPAYFPEKKPSQFIEYIFSTLGSAEWPPNEEWVDEIEKEQMHVIGQPLVPTGYRYFAHNYEPEIQKQVVVKVKDEKSILVEVYENSIKPVFEKEWEFKEIK